MTQNARHLPTRTIDSGGVLDYDTRFDPNGNVSDIYDYANGSNYNRHMQYDGLDRLTAAGSWAFGGDGWHRFTYDSLDNMKSWKLAGVKDYATYNYTNNQLTSIQNTGGATLVGLSYDVQGNLYNKNGQLHSFDYGNRLREIPGKEYYRYDGHGRRISAWSPASGSLLPFYSNAGQLLYQDDQRRSKTEEYIYLAGSLLTIRERDQPTNVYTFTYQHTDALGSPVAVTNASGTVIKRNFYEPYGAVVNQPTYGGFGYTGHVQDAVTGLTYMQQRYYDPQIGLFLSVDPVTAHSAPGQNFNRYWYANNNPYRFTDPDGRLACDGNFECRDKIRELEQRGVFPLQAKGGSSESQHRKGCDTSECDEVMATRAGILRDQGEALKEAGKFGLKEAGSMAAGGPASKLLGRIGRFLGIGKKADNVAFRSDTSHIFRNARGHLADDTPANRALLQGAVRPENLVGTRGPGGSISVYRETLSDGRQVWVEVRGGSEITNGEVNLTPRP